MDVSPRFPPELEALIFTYAAYLSTRTVSDLLLVARRVHTWIEPLRYRVLKIEWCTSPKFLRLLSQKSPDFLSAHVSVLMLDDYTDFNIKRQAWLNSVNEVLKHCHEIVDFTLVAVACPVIDWASYTHLRVLTLSSIASQEFREMLNNTLTLILPHITHLEYSTTFLYRYLLDDQMVASQLPGLTHFMLSRWTAILRPQLRYFLLLGQLRLLVIQGVDKKLALLDDERLVVIPPCGRDLKLRWKLRTSGDKRYDLWEIAESILRLRRST
ncbi:hypothetical protein DL96DRAFT_1621454 [Flagelloscypha sp. PMI_526]|nr:hypothetical protein DL96DRAFT_1621454 [Flagelloscypha sp. PMI_526]